MTPLADAYMDSVPVVAITGQVPSGLIGTDGFQEADIAGITLPITKHNFLVTSADDIARTVAEAFHVASTGRPGPVLVDIAKDALQAQTTFRWPVPFDLPGYHPVTRPHSRQVREAARMMTAAQRPVLYVGGGVIKAGASEELVALAELTGMPVVTTLMARGGFPSSHPQNVGMPGMHGTVAAVGALQKSDLLVALGARFDDRVTGKLDSFAPGAAIIHADIDPAEISKNRRADVPIVGDCREVITELLAAVQAEHEAGHGADLTAWWSQLDAWRTTYPLGYSEPEDGSLAPQYVIERIGKLAGPDAVYVAGRRPAPDVGRAVHRATSTRGTGSTPAAWAPWATRCPAAMGAKVGRPEAAVWAIDGDGCFQMTNQELATCAVEGIPIKVAVINNGNLGMVRQWQTLFYNERYSQTDLDKVSAAATVQPDPAAAAGARVSLGTRIPDFVKLAEAYGCVGLRCEERRRRGRGDRRGHEDRRPAGRDRLRRAPGRHGVADGGGGHQQRRHHRGAEHGAGLGCDGMSSHPHACGSRIRRRAGTRCRCWWRTSPGCWCGPRACSRAAGSTSTRSPSGRPSTRRSPG